MSFGSPGGRSLNIKPTPPERGSFPLDHDGECKYLISTYLNCLKSAGGVNDEQCRKLAKGYLSCRMEKNLMAPDDFKNLGLVFNDDDQTGTRVGEQASAANSTAKQQ
ncbi:hypothetical protein VTO42DRAFT_4187 [Malbranchea cinnamomea]